VPAVNNAVGPLQTLDYEFHGPAAVTWTGVDMNSGGGADMDQVDNGGQAALIMGETGSPAFEAIEGMGLLVVEGPGSHFLGITEISLIGPAPENDL